MNDWSILRQLMEAKVNLQKPQKLMRCLGEQYGVYKNGTFLGDIMSDGLRFSVKELIEKIKALL
jgi:hypothetical protein